MEDTSPLFKGSMLWTNNLHFVFCFVKYTLEIHECTHRNKLKVYIKNNNFYNHNFSISYNTSITHIECIGRIYKVKQDATSIMSVRHMFMFSQFWKKII